MGGHDDGATRHQAREHALSLLYEAEMKGRSPSEVIAELPLPPAPFTQDLLRAVERHQPEIDRLIGDSALHWAPERMAVVDRLLLRLGIAELLDPGGAPVAVVIDEAVELAKTFSTEGSGAFVNGILSAVATRLGRQ